MTQETRGMQALKAQLDQEVLQAQMENQERLISTTMKMTFATYP